MSHNASLITTPNKTVFIGGEQLKFGWYAIWDDDVSSGDKFYFKGQLGYKIGNGSITWGSTGTFTKTSISEKDCPLEAIAMTITLPNVTTSTTITLYAKYSYSWESTSERDEMWDEPSESVVTITVNPANTAPTINGNDSSLGEKYETFNISFVVGDAQDKGNLQFTAKLDNVQLTTYPVAQNSANSYSIPTAKFSALSLGTHTLKLIVADSGGLTATRTYTFIKVNPPNVAPTINGYDENLGQQYKSFTQNFIVDDANPNDTITVVVKLDNNQINNFIAKRNVNYVVDLAGVFKGLALGQHLITITASDNNGASVTRTYTFEKINSPYGSIDFTKTVETRKLVTEIPYICEEFVHAQAVIDTVYILASNNPFDEEPVWEEIAAAPYTFKNKISTNYGIGIRVVIERNNNVSAKVLATDTNNILTTNRNEAIQISDEEE